MTPRERRDLLRLRAEPKPQPAGYTIYSPSIEAALVTTSSAGGGGSASVNEGRADA